MSSRRGPQYATEMVSCLCQSKDGEQELQRAWQGAAAGPGVARAAAQCRAAPAWAVGDQVDMAGVGECREKVTHVLR